MLVLSPFSFNLIGGGGIKRLLLNNNYFKRFSINNPEERIQEYLKVEIYSGYDDKHAIDDLISQGDIRAANQLYARIRQETAKRLQTSLELQNSLSEIMIYRTQINYICHRSVLMPWK
jgi:hypothetical protein